MKRICIFLSCIFSVSIINAFAITSYRVPLELEYFEKPIERALVSESKEEKLGESTSRKILTAISFLDDGIFDGNESEGFGMAEQTPPNKNCIPMRDKDSDYDYSQNVSFVKVTYYYKNRYNDATKDCDENIKWNVIQWVPKLAEVVVVAPPTSPVVIPPIVIPPVVTPPVVVPPTYAPPILGNEIKVKDVEVFLNYSLAFMGFYMSNLTLSLTGKAIKLLTIQGDVEIDRNWKESSFKNTSSDLLGKVNDSNRQVVIDKYQSFFNFDNKITKERFLVNIKITLRDGSVLYSQFNGVAEYDINNY